MDKLKMQTADIVNENVEKIGAMFPNAVTEVQGKRVVDFDILRQELANEVVEGREERYEFTWPDKRKAIRTANTPISSTLRPCIEESVNFENTENLYIEGDNLDVLKLLRETYLSSIKMIYIDPPYNTGNDFIYNDNFTMNKEDYDGVSGEYDEDCNRLERNADSNGRFHTDWLNMMYPRLKLARDLLSDDGVIFISIDDNEVHNLRKVCDEIFGAGNFVAEIIWEKAFSPKNDAKFISNSHDYVLAYTKSINNFVIGKFDRTEDANNRYSNPDNDPRGAWISGDLTVKSYSAKYDYPITTPSGRVVNPSHGTCWRVSKEKLTELIKENLIWFGANGSNVPRLKRFLHEVQEGMTPTSIWKYADTGHNQEGRQEVKELFNGKAFFDSPKPVRLLKKILKIANTNLDSVILDFFSGSATTAHAVMQLNSEDGGNRKFIMVQIPEKCDEKSEAYKAGYKNICEIGKERIRRAGEKIKNQPVTTENADNLKKLDIGFRVLKLDSSNMKNVYYTPDEYAQADIERFIDNVESDRTPQDLLFQIMLELGVNLSANISHETIGGKTIYTVTYAGQNFIKAVLDEDVPESVITEMAKTKPYHAVIKNTSMSSDSMAANFEQIFKSYSSETKVRVL